MTCRDVLAFLSEYVTGDLPRDAREAFARHLDVCASCRAYLDSYERTIGLANSVSLDDDRSAPPELAEAILASLGRRK